MLTPVESAVDLARELAHNPFSERITADPIGIGRRLLEGALVDGTTDRSLNNAHVEGLRSYILFDREQTGGGKIRLFSTEMGNNEMGRFIDWKKDDYTCHPHDHTFQLTIIPLVGDLLHLKSVESDNPRETFKLHKFLFAPAIGTGEYGLNYAGLKPLEVPQPDQLAPGEMLQLDSDIIHSVTNFELGPWSNTAWIVIEGPEQAKPPTLYSASQNPKLDATGLYIPATKIQVDREIGDTLRDMDRGY